MVAKPASKSSKNGSSLQTPAYKRNGKAAPSVAQPAQVADAAVKPETPTQPPMGVRVPSINDVRLAGRLTADPIVRDANGRKVINFSIAAERSYLTSDNKWAKKVAFIPCSAFGAIADRSTPMLKKGKPVYLEGRLQQNSWEGKDGVKRNEVRLEAYKIQSLERSQSQSMSR